MIKEIKTEEVINAGEQIKTPEQQEKKVIELLKLISEKTPTFWEDDCKDVKIIDLIKTIDKANPVLREKIIDDILEKYYDNCETNRSSNVFIEAPHGMTPSLTETKLILRQYDEFKDVDSELIKKIFDKLGVELFDQEENSNQTFTQRRVKLKRKCESNITERIEFIDRILKSSDGNEKGRQQFMAAAKKDVLENELKLTMLKIIAGSDVYVSELAMAIAGAEYNYTNPAISRKMSDSNKLAGLRRINKKTKRLESGHGSALAQHYALKRAMKNNQDEPGAENNFYHVTLLERDSRKPFTIGAGARNEMLPCEMEVMKYIARELEIKLKEQSILKKEGESYEVFMDMEKKFKGAEVNTQRRWGQGAFEGMGLGEKYNTIQLAIPSFALKNHGTEVANILQEILREL